MTKNIYLLVSNSWGAVDWIIPVIVSIKEKYINCRITTVLEARSIEKVFGKNVILRDLCIKYSDEVFTNEQFREKILKKYFILNILYVIKKIFRDRNILPLLFYKIYRKFIYYIENYCLSRKTVIKKLSEYLNISILLRDLCGSPRPLFQSYFMDIVNLNNGLDIIYPATTDFYFYTKKYGTDRKWKHEADFMLVNSAAMADNYLNKGRNGKNKCIITMPRYDKWWIERLLQIHKNYQEAEDLKKKIGSKKAYLLLIRGPRKNILTETNYDYLMKTSIETISKDENSFIIVKAHPRQTYEEISRYMAVIPNDRWEISSLHGMYLGSISNIVISFAVSVIFDVLCLGKPVIEYYVYNETDTQYTQDWRNLGFVLPANNKDELTEKINIVNKSQDGLGFLQSFRKYVPESYDQMTNKVLQNLNLN